MTSDAPIACSLSAAELPSRLAEVRAIGRDALLSARDGTLYFRDDSAIRTRLEDVIAAESKCCSFLSFELREDAGELALSIHAPEGGEPVADDLAAAFQDRLAEAAR
jgi:hypothetical protein